MEPPVEAPSTGPRGAQGTRGRWRAWVVPVFLAAGAFALYSTVATHAFIHFDDHEYVTENRIVLAGLTWRGVIWAFTTFHAANWHPLTWLSHMIDVQLFGVAPGAHHLVSAALHGVNAALLYLALRRMTGAAGRSAAVAAVFAAHPLAVESVAWVAERKDVLSTAFAFAMLWAYAWHAERPGPRRLVPVALLLGASLLSKPMWVTAPFLLLLLDVWPLRRIEGISLAARAPPIPVLPLRRLVAEKVPLLALSAVSGTITVLAQRRTDALADVVRLGLGARMANAVVSYGRYLGKIFWPGSLAVFYPHRGDGLPAAAVGGSAVLLVAISIAAAASLRRRPWLGIGWCWFVGMLVPVIGLVQVGAQAMADRYAYVPLVGVSVAVVWETAMWLDRLRAGQHAAAAVAAAALVALAAVTRHQLGYWKDHETLFRHAAEVVPDNARAHEVLALEAQRRGRIDEAEAHFKEAARIEPANVRVWYDLGVLYRQAGRLAEARDALGAALRVEPRHVRAWVNLGGVELAAGELAGAEAAFRRAVEVAPADPQAWLGLGGFEADVGRPETAVSAYRRAAELDPGSTAAWSNLGVALQRLGRIEDAADAFSAATRADPQSFSAWRNLGLFLVRAGRLPEAADALRRGLDLRPGDPAALMELGLVYAAEGMRQEAEAIAVRLRAVDPARADELLRRSSPR